VPRWSNSRSGWLLCLAAIIVLGLLSRSVHTGFVLFDKYLGDALYAAMVYAILRLRWSGPRVPIAAMTIMLAIETFQLTGIPAHMPSLIARALGTTFSFTDLAAYAIGIASLYLADRSSRGRRNAL
jgi:hypothetical protein